MGEALNPCDFSDLATTSTSILRLQKMMALVQLSPSALISARRTARFSAKDLSLRVGWNWISFCSIVVEVVACRATSILTAQVRKVLVMRSISGAMVAE